MKVQALPRQKKLLYIALIAAVVLLLLVLGGWHFLWQKSASSYDDCVKQGNPVLDSYPSQCVDKTGKHFTNPAEHPPATPR